MPSLSWDDIVRDPKYRQGYVELRDTDGFVYGGPVSLIRGERGGFVRIELAWTAMMDPATREWVWAPEGVARNFNIPLEIIPEVIGESRVRLRIPMAGTLTLYPRDQHQLRREDVVDRVFSLKSR